MSSRRSVVEIVRRVEFEAHVHLHPANGRQVITVRIEEQAAEQRFGGFARGRFTGAHDAIDIGQRLIAHAVGQMRLVRLHRAANPGAGIHMVDVEHVHMIKTGLRQNIQMLLRDFVAGFDVDGARLFVDEIMRGIAADDFIVRHQQRDHAIGLRFPGDARRNLLAFGEQQFTGGGVHHVERRLHAAPLFRLIGNAPAVQPVVALEPHLAIEMVEDFLAVHAQRIEQSRDRQLALPVDADVHNVLGVELEVQPRTAIGDDAGGKEEFAAAVGLATVMIEEHAGRAVHLADDHPLGAVDDEGAVRGHERHVAHIHILLLDIDHGTGAGVGIDFKHDQAQRHPHRRGIGHAALAALVHVIFRGFQFILDEIQLRRAGEILDREDAAQRLFEAGDIADGRARAQELLIAFPLHLDQVRHLHGFGDIAKDFADAARRLIAIRGGGTNGVSGLGRHVAWSFA